jgi:hypothetical protein
MALVLSILFGYMLFKSRRFIEYFPAFALIFAALSSAPLLEKWQKQRPRLRWLFPIGMILLMLLPIRFTLTEAREAMSRSKPADHYANAALWLGNNAAPGHTVFQTDWDDFTRLFFYHGDTVYTAGLDPTYMELYDEDLYDEWVDITRGKVDNPSGVIGDRFGATHVFSDLKHDDFIDRAEADPNLRELYRDDYAVIYAVAD